MFPEMILPQHSFHFKFPRAGLSAFFMRCHYPLVSPFLLQGCLKDQGTPCYSQPPLLNLAIPFTPLCFAHIIQGIREPKSTIYLGFPIFTPLFKLITLLWELFFFFYCSQASNHSSRVSFSMKTPVTLTHRPLPNPHISRSHTEGKGWWGVNTESPRDTEEKSFLKPL